MTPLQYLLVGFPYSGKTTLAKELEKRLGFARINIDQLKFDRGYTDVGDDDVPDEVWDQIFTEADTILTDYLRQGKNVANEYAWITKKWRDRARKVAKDAGFNTNIVYLKVPEEVIRLRRRENMKSKERFHWNNEEFERNFIDFEALDPEEDYIVYDQTIPLDEWIDKHMR